MSTLQNNNNEVPKLNDLCSLVSDTAFKQLSGAANKRSTAKATLTTQVTEFGADGNGTTVTKGYEASVSLGVSSSTQPAAKSCHCGCADSTCCCCNSSK